MTWPGIFSLNRMHVAVECGFKWKEIRQIRRSHGDIVFAFFSLVLIKYIVIFDFS